MEVARRGEDTGYGVPCLFVSAKDDLDSYPMAIRDSEAVIIFFEQRSITKMSLLSYIYFKKFPFLVF